MRKINYRWFMTFHLFECIYIRRVPKQNRCVKKWKVKPISELKIDNYKSSNTIFILASGSSINNISQDQWTFIKNHNSLGFNKWLYHDHVPTYYCLETSNKQERVNIVYQLLESKKNDYADVPIIYRGSDQNRIFNVNSLPGKFKKNIYISNEIPLPSTNNEELYHDLNYFSIKKYFIPSNKIHLLFRIRASLDFNIFFALMAGYKNIVLCGVDFNNIDYFYQSNPEHYLKKGLPFLDPGQTGNIHRTVDPIARPNIPTIDNVVYTINDVLLKPNKINLYVACKSSGLYPKLPAYFK